MFSCSDINEQKHESNKIHDIDVVISLILNGDTFQQLFIRINMHNTYFLLGYWCGSAIVSMRARMKSRFCLFCFVIRLSDSFTTNIYIYIIHIK